MASLEVFEVDRKAFSRADMEDLKKKEISVNGTADTAYSIHVKAEPPAEWSSELVFYVNGKRVVEKNPPPEMTLLQYLRRSGLTGTKLGCGEGGCGACTVMVSHVDPATRKLVHKALNACLCPLAAVAGSHVITVEGIGSTKEGLHPIQQRLVDMHGSQCGFCTPGIVMALYALFRNKPNAKKHEIEEALDGNLCRCTGYRPILDAARSLASDNKEFPCPMGEACCRLKKEAKEEQLLTPSPQRRYRSISVETREQLVTVATCSCCKISSLSPYAHSEKELIFPPELHSYKVPPLRFESGDATWYTPTSLAQLLYIKREHLSAKLVMGSTEVTIERQQRRMHYPVMIGLHHVPELAVLDLDPNSGKLIIGAAVTLTRLKEELQAASKMHPTKHQGGSIFQAFLDQLRWFSSTQIRNAASVGGNIVTASPIADLNPIFLATDSTFVVASADGGVRRVAASDFFVDYRKVALQPGEVLVCAEVPVPEERPGVYTLVHAFKQSKRREDDISIVTAGMRIVLEEPQTAGTAPRVVDCTLAYGGMWRKAVFAKKTQAYLIGKEWSRETLEGAYPLLMEDMPLAEGAPGGMPQYRTALALSFLFKFFLATQQDRGERLSEDESLAVAPFSRRPLSHGFQEYQERKGRNANVVGPALGTGGGDGESHVGVGKQHAAAALHVTGEAIYTDDMPSPPGTVYVGLVLSERPHARITSFDASAALELPGVVRIITANDVPGNNTIGEVEEDEELLAKEVVKFVGHPIAVVVAESPDIAHKAVGLVKVTYEDLPAILTIEEAIAANSFMGGDHRLDFGDVEAVLSAPDAIVVEGDIKIGGQEHFYLEPQNALVVPGERDEITVFSSTQNPTAAQDFVCHVLGLPAHKVVCRVKRMGGGFGGKETRSLNVACYAAVAAYLTKRPARLCLDRDVDMAITGQRHPFFARYRASATKEGKLLALDVELYSNGGMSLDLSSGVRDRAIFHVDNAYKWQALRVVGRICRTNLPSNTAFRGFGGPQGMMACEVALDHLAATLGISPAELRERNLYKENDVTHFRQRIGTPSVQRCWNECKIICSYDSLTREVDEFNRTHRYQKRGVATLPTKFGIAFTATFLNQGGALVHVYKDGTVLLSHGGTEMGQGLHTKMIQVAAHTLGIPPELIHISETATDRVANTSATAASFSSDINGMAVMDACNQLRDRLAPLRAKYPELTWQELVKKAYFERIDLSAHGFHKVPGIGWNFEKQEGTPFRYFTTGAACAVVEVDVLTGGFQILSTDIVMDLGVSLNPALDVGQIEGAFTQGVGWCTMEELVIGSKEHAWVRPGHFFTKGPGTYKLPAFNDVPLKLNVHLLRDTPNPVAIYSSKAVGEPPLFLGATVFFAIKHALASARADNGLAGYFLLDSPASCERIRMAAGDKLAASALAATKADPRTFRPRLAC